ncbi:MAG TPA: DUF1501 domain-containing protein [Armatimonadota bacterium]|nr:DUF1501 domain-containing protein [Armatimonadota bacterium]
MHRTQVIPHFHRSAMCRREVLQVGFSGALGMSMLSAFGPRRAEAAAKGPKAKGVILVWMPGGPPQMQFWDPKPDSPAECRGTAKPIKTPAPGLEIGHRLPLIAQQGHRFALVRSITLNAEDDNHILGDQKLLSAINPTPANFTPFANRDEWPSMGSVITYAKPNTTGLPTAIHVPYRVRFSNQGVVGESAGWLGSKYDPWLTQGDPNAPDFHVPDLLPVPGFTVDRLGHRQRLLEQIDAHRRDLDTDLGARQLTDAQQRAFSVTTSQETRRAFDLKQETDALRDRYGRHIWGQSLLLARRLSQAGVKFVQVNLGDHVNYWDYHEREDALMDQHCPPFDKAFSAFLEDLHGQGMLDETLVLCLSEMGRNPILGKSVAGAAANAATRDGRNHWQWCWTGLVAGAGVRGGTVVGESDEWAGYVKSDPVFPADIGATVYQAMGIDPRLEVRDIQNRPMYVNDGHVIDKLF